MNNGANANSGTPESPPAAWSHFAHGADIGVRGEGANLEQAFAQAALALTGVVTDPGSVRPREAVAVRVSAPDSELLLVDFLNAIVWHMAARRMVFSRFEVEIEDGALRAEAWGEAVDPARHRPAVEVKGATYTGLRVACAADRCVAECVVDV